MSLPNIFVMINAEACAVPLTKLCNLMTSNMVSNDPRHSLALHITQVSKTEWKLLTENS
jgi:hypothetical protein